ncbi:MAG TPA: asparagine synthase-related protein [Thermoanaerobaculia bacterium]|nr:asparagine synthase-related protein [Thermoanaerobaculia bacterium]
MKISWLRAGPDVGVSNSPCPHFWFAGFIANRSDLIARVGATPEESDASLLLRVCDLDPAAAPYLVFGQCAWVYWHEPSGRLYAVRDRLGTRTLFYTQRDDRFLLSNRLEDLLPEGTPALNETSIARQICGRGPDPGETFYRDFRSIDAGTVLVVERDRLTTRTYWRPETNPCLGLSSDAAYAEVFRERFVAVVSDYLPSEPWGITLSGGLDSVAIAAAAKRASPALSMIAFSWASPELPEADESRLAAEVCSRLGCRQVTIAADRAWPLRSELRPPRSSPFVLFYSELWEETFRVVRSEGVRVLSSGMSGDHLVGANVFSYPDLLLRCRWSRLVSELAGHRRSGVELRWLLRRLVIGPAVRWLIPRRLPSPRPAWLGPRLREHGEPPAPAIPRRLLPGRRHRLEHLLDPSLRMIAGQMTSRAEELGIDFRHPWLDHRLFELAASLPSEQTFAAGSQKVVLRNALRGLLPSDVVDRLGKTYPTPIFNRGLREREREKVRGLLTNMQAARRGFVDEASLRATYERYLAGATNDVHFWYSLTLEAWLRLHFS